MDHQTALSRALKLGEEKYKDAPAAHHAAFANSVAYALTGMSGGYGGPSMREHWAGRLAHQAGTPGQIDFEQAVSICEKACYGPLMAEIAQMLLDEHCFDDAPGELEEALRLLQEEEKKGGG